MGIEHIPEGILHSQSLFTIDNEHFHFLLEAVFQEIRPYIREESGENIENKVESIFKEKESKRPKISKPFTSMRIAMHYNRKSFDVEGFKIAQPEAAIYIDGFCHLLRAKVALTLFPEKIEELIVILQSENLHEWNPSILEQEGRVALKMWLSDNVRDRHGKIDWKIITQKVNQLYPCELRYMDHRDAFTPESALETARKVADEFIMQKGHWHPAYDLERKDKAVYSYLTGLDQFRRPSDRPDIDHRKDTRPNWFAIAKAMGPDYESTMIVGLKGNEQKLRTFDEAIDELCDTVKDLGWNSWNANKLMHGNSALYAWFKYHCRNEMGKVDILRILKALPIEIREKYANYEPLDTE
ncbi:MAG: hypothetical protein JWM56_347 [Candidatus Peribacteria bacterium]|nr:hypothetical protein [Candidatus Peribacteria bacterium]